MIEGGLGFRAFANDPSTLGCEHLIDTLLLCLLGVLSDLSKNFKAW